MRIRTHDATVRVSVDSQRGLTVADSGKCGQNEVVANQLPTNS